MRWPGSAIPTAILTCTSPPQVTSNTCFTTVPRVHAFPRKVMQMAPGITVSQAVVAIEGDFADHASSAINVLEQRLRAQRNRPTVQHPLGWMVSERARRTGAPQRGEGCPEGCRSVTSGQLCLTHQTHCATDRP